MEIKIAEYSGYCFGVKRALKLTMEAIEKTSNKNKKIFTIGSIIHNPGVKEELSKKGLISVNKVEEISDKSIFIIRSHGMAPYLINRIRKEKEAEIVDTTCPFVKKVQSKAGLLSKNGYFVVIIGNKDHPEVLGIKGCISNKKYAVIENEEDAEKLKCRKKIGVVIQTTQTKEKLFVIANKLLDKTGELLLNNTICDTTEKMQLSTRKLAGEVDIMIIVGGRQSANTGHLNEISEKINKSTYHIENYRELNPEWFINKKRAGISGGASTPIKDIIDVKKAIEKLQYTQKNKNL
jgi:(E)-4-hydroxy-3-methyl-but-2-enyl pyrophosphate reductase